MFVTEHDEMDIEKRKHELPFVYSMMLPAFKGVDAVFGIEGLTQARGFIIVDKRQRNVKYRNIFAAGTPKTGHMIESMVTETVANIHAELNGLPADKEATWNAVCLADFGNS